MTIIDRSITINTDIQTVWDYAVDASRAPEWFEGLEEQIPDDNWPSVGATATNVYSAAGLRLENKITITEFEEYRKVTFQLDGMLNGTFTWTYTGDDGETHVHAHLDYELAGGAIGQLANKLVFERTNVSNMEKTLQNLKANTES